MCAVQADMSKSEDDDDYEENEEDAGVPGDEGARELRRRRKLGLEEEVDRLRAQVNSVNAFTVQELQKKVSHRHGPWPDLTIRLILVAL